MMVLTNSGMLGKMSPLVFVAYCTCQSVIEIHQDQISRTTTFAAIHSASTAPRSRRTNQSQGSSQRFTSNGITPSIVCV